MNKNKLVIFGIGKAADVIYFFFNNHSDYEVVAFTVDSKYNLSGEYNGLPVVDFESVDKHFSISDHVMFVAMGYKQLNKFRALKLTAAKEKGYEIVSFIHPDSGVPKDLILGENCFIMHNVNIHPHVKIGDNVFIWSGTILSHHSSIGNHCWFTSGVNIAGNVKIGDYCFFAINSTVTNDVSIGNECFLGANSLINKNLGSQKVMIESATKEFLLNSLDFLKMKNNKF